MASRDRTGLFLSFRAAYDHNASSAFRGSRYSLDQDEDRQTLLAQSGLDSLAKSDTVIAMDVLPPRWVDMTDEVDEHLAKIRKIQQQQLEPLHRKHMLPGFDDRTGEEREIAKLTTDITRLFAQCSRLIKQVQRQAQEPDIRDVDRLMARNVTQALAAKVSAENGEFRRAQSKYLARMRGHMPARTLAVEQDSRRRSDAESSVGLSNQQQQQQQRQKGGRIDAVISQREREIDAIAQGITEISQIFQELNSMVIHQGTLLDRIDYNIDTMHVSMQQASKELVKAEGYQARSRKRKLMLLLALLILAAILVLIYKPIARRRASPPIIEPPNGIEPEVHFK
ncbi:t-SNARE [Protomyces lactucae-debilis]|uniref:t-SNARE n=1 Tax=Protomyces lactucae-debilis TaxID=2754530 RepID=A0A1Y2FLJ8_PROLT|nr:t-SNARE [Protomyces lactucae-debilis]ORY84809.1 t-SNARE [Protomyces lactucae-debilis]